ncbi:hypothetical protein [Streptomyces malaysiensis]|uniref:ABM domain-containing protein n=1 Tax=Streptomyces malaysiensis subsp. samsunensis TaxID=459658 RepID=A0A9X2LVP2_STRMQ|nr:hypothetical protein [Streptomyces samsunensis]MCQ8830065.1 hypothetical protein [Streptomyces samsunensis]
MFARVQNFHQPAEKLDELTAFMRKQLPTAPDLSGFKAIYFLTDRDNERALLISLWETEEGARHPEGHAAVRERTAAETGVESPPAEVFEVALQAS